MARMLFIAAVAFATLAVSITDWGHANAQERWLHSGARSLTCYQGGFVILNRSPVYGLRELSSGSRIRFDFHRNGPRGPKETFSVVGQDIACVVSDADRYRQRRVLPGHHTIRCVEDGVLIVPSTAVHGVTVTEANLSLTYSYAFVSRSAPRQSVTVEKSRGRCFIEPLKRSARHFR